MISLQEVCVSYKSQDVLSNISFEIETGDKFIILGSNGSGKSTILKVIAGLVKPSSGNVIIEEKLGFHGDVENRSKMGVLIERASSYKHLSVSENLQYRAILLNTKVGNVSDFIKESKLEEHLHKKVGELSMGNVQKLGLALALLDNPEILLLDEPTSALDPESTLQFDELLCQINRKKGTTIVLVSHDMEEAKRVGNKILKVENGAGEIESVLDQKQHFNIDDQLKQACQLISKNIDFCFKNGKITEN